MRLKAHHVFLYRLTLYSLGSSIFYFGSGQYVG